MKNLTYCLIALLQWGYCSAQKPVLNIKDCQDWPEVAARAELSHDGKFCYYQVKDNIKNPYFIQSTEGKWKMELHDISSAEFSKDSKQFYALAKKDTLIIIDLNTRLVRKISNVKSYELFMQSAKEWLVTKQKGPQKLLCVSELNGTKVINYSNVVSHFWAEDGNSMLIERDSIWNNGLHHQLVWLDLISYKEKIMYTNNNISMLTIDDNSKQAAFFVKNQGENQIWYWNRQMNEAKLVVSDKTYKFKDEFFLDLSTGYWSFRFSQNGKSLFFGLQEKQLTTTDQNNLVLSYKDTYLPDKLPVMGVYPKPSKYFASLNLSSNQILRLVGDNEIWIRSFFESPPDNYIIIAQFHRSPDDKNFDIESSKRSYYLRSTDNGLSLPIQIDRDHKERLSALSLSPGGNYVIFYDLAKGGYYSYSIKTKRVKAIALDMKESVTKYTNFNVPDSIHGYLVGAAGWLKDDKAVWIIGRYNIWQVDPDGNKPSINLTGNQGLQDSIVYYLPDNRYKIVNEKSNSVILSAFNLKNKKLGFYKMSIGQSLKYQDIFFQDKYFMDLDGYNKLDDVSFSKSDLDDAFLFRLESSTSAPNYLYSRDLKSFQPISNLQPQNKFNWMTTELHTYRDINGKVLQGVLYKPENFDPNKKYPVIFYYYESKSQELNAYVSPSNFEVINIPLLVSNGYLIFKADIYSVPTKVGEGALTSVMAAADYLSKFSFVDSSKMALAGHSFGGYETNYIVTHSNRFAAAITAAGMSNLITHYYKQDGYFGVRTGQLKMIYKPEEDENLYIQNSPIFFVKRVNTPLLILQNRDDPSVYFDQGFYFFNELRKEKKVAWMLSYQGEGHGLGEGNFLDYSHKTLGFLDYYLKRHVKPEWMK